MMYLPPWWSTSFGSISVAWSSSSRLSYTWYLNSSPEPNDSGCELSTFGCAWARGSLAVVEGTAGGVAATGVEGTVREDELLPRTRPSHPSRITYVWQPLQRRNGHHGVAGQRVSSFAPKGRRIGEANAPGETHSDDRSDGSVHTCPTHQASSRGCQRNQTNARTWSQPWLGLKGKAKEQWDAPAESPPDVRTASFLGGPSSAEAEKIFGGSIDMFLGGVDGSKMRQLVLWRAEKA